jgi:hypothetical protein
LRPLIYLNDVVFFFPFMILGMYLRFRWVPDSWQTSRVVTKSFDSRSLICIEKTELSFSLTLTWSNAVFLQKHLSGLEVFDLHGPLFILRKCILYVSFRTVCIILWANHMPTSRPLNGGKFLSQSKKWLPRLEWVGIFKQSSDDLALSHIGSLGHRF